MVDRTISQGCIYYLCNKVNGKGYVGQHCTPKVIRRIRGHFQAAANGEPKPLYRAIRKYGAENFSTAVLWRGSCDKLDVMEMKFIKKLHTFVDDRLGAGGYNLTTGGESRKRLSVECRKVMGRKVKAAWRRPDVRAKFAATNLEMRAKVSAAHKARLKDPVEREKLRQINLRRYEDPKERARASKVQKRCWADTAIRARKIDANKARWSRPEEHIKASAAALCRWDRPGERIRAGAWLEKTARFNRGRKQSDQTKARMAKARQAYIMRCNLARSGWGHPWRLKDVGMQTCAFVEEFV